MKISSDLQVFFENCRMRNFLHFKIRTSTEKKEKIHFFSISKKYLNFYKKSEKFSEKMYKIYVKIYRNSEKF